MKTTGLPSSKLTSSKRLKLRIVTLVSKRLSPLRRWLILACGGEESPAPIRRGPPLPRAGAGGVARFAHVKEPCAHLQNARAGRVLWGVAGHLDIAPAAG